MSTTMCKRSICCKRSISETLAGGISTSVVALHVFELNMANKNFKGHIVFFNSKFFDEGMIGNT